jgi:hypothetical protein
MVARDYAPATGTFTQLDSVQGTAANPLTMNRYLYVHANPATFIDPDGHAKRGSPGGGGSGGLQPEPTYCDLYPARCDGIAEAGGGGGGTNGGGGNSGGAAPPSGGTSTPSLAICDRSCETPWLDPHRFDGVCLLVNPNVNSGWYQPACLQTYTYRDPNAVDPNTKAFLDAFVVSAGLAAIGALCIAITAGGCTPLVLGAGVALGWAGGHDIVRAHGFDIGDIHVGGSEPWTEQEIWSLAGSAVGGCVGGCFTGRLPAYNYTGILADHMAAGVAQFNRVGLTVGQKTAVAKYPQYKLERMFMGERIDTFAKASAAADPRLSGMRITGRGEFGPDFAMDYRWWDVTTRGSWQAHIDTYAPAYGPNAYGLWYQPRPPLAVPVPVY